MNHLTQIYFYSRFADPIFLANPMEIVNIAGYQFSSLNELENLRNNFLFTCRRLTLRGTLLLSTEGININLAGESDKITEFLTWLKEDTRFCRMTFHTTFSKFLPYKCLKVKIKPEIITLRQANATPNEDNEAPRISPQELKAWLDEGRDITLFDTRNDYEVRFGTFRDAVQLNLKNFCELPAAVSVLDKEKPVVMFCTGGIRCEKAGLHLLQQGFSQVYQLDGGILGYFAEVGGAHYTGECFVFDERVAVDTDLQDTDTRQCVICQGPMVAAAEQAACASCQ